MYLPDWLADVQVIIISQKVVGFEVWIENSEITHLVLVFIRCKGMPDQAESTYLHLLERVRMK